jgi:hypothetical protein
VLLLASFSNSRVSNSTSIPFPYLQSVTVYGYLMSQIETFVFSSSGWSVRSYYCDSIVTERNVGNIVKTVTEMGGDSISPRYYVRLIQCRWFRHKLMRLSFKEMFKVTFCLTITVLKIINCPVFWLKHDVSENEFCLRVQVRPTQFGQIDIANLCPRTHWGDLGSFHLKMNIESSPKRHVLNKIQNEEECPKL